MQFQDYSTQPITVFYEKILEEKILEEKILEEKILIPNGCITFTKTKLDPEQGINYSKEYRLER